ncbi:hypothetical protein M441DRAFT_266466 [Trichoderma asperellum CBS 433.97]|uniref:Uncharacterized protein n=1 Tax=Trichoderma asperellum (strain ATCC 204424 / CBS 433.97 / NBRC 101777) TaxID=1042311 RepID=A0A2T3YXW9_TRIA4|nr:hypothetical protein M441DRAFT_266466 [Trichoderma asperellum CBS 433.97]PTB37421.1 hypothetical protein M441DRAFT_266466 [Trichoderma asperellum CBS 433.97]
MGRRKTQRNDIIASVFFVCSSAGPLFLQSQKMDGWMDGCLCCSTASRVMYALLPNRPILDKTVVISRIMQCHGLFS